MSTKTTWQRTPTPNLLRNAASGKYYARWKIGGKQKWLSLKTDVFSVAKLRLVDESAKIERVRGSKVSVEAGAGTLGDLMRAYEEQINGLTERAPATIEARRYALKRLQKTWPGLELLKPAQVTPTAVWEWVRRYKTGGAAFTPPGAKKAIRGNSSSSVNSAIDALREVMEIAIERGQIFGNPVRVKPREEKNNRLKKKREKKRLTLPSNTDVQRLLHAIENNGAEAGWGIEAADFCRFLSFSGCRRGEVKTVTWASVDWMKKSLRVKGYKTETSDRDVPLFPALKTLLKSVEKRRKRTAKLSVDGKPIIEPTERVFRLSECQKSIDAACSSTGIVRITHHDFRHLFATRCIESGVDIPTVSKWLGHADGGELCMKTYGHLRQEHSQAQAAKVNFGGAK